MLYRVITVDAQTVWLLKGVMTFHRTQRSLILVCFVGVLRLVYRLSRTDARNTFKVLVVMLQHLSLHNVVGNVIGKLTERKDSHLFLTIRTVVVHTKIRLNPFVLHK